MEYFKNTLIQVTNEGMGQGEPELSILLVNNYFKLLLENNQLPKIIVFYNAGVKLLDETTSTAELLIGIEKKGVQLVACKTCLNFYNIKQATGSAGTMIDIIELQNKADKVINL